MAGGSNLEVSKKHILIVDDQSSIRSVVKSYFRGMGFDNISMAADGAEALTYLSQKPVDIIICVKNKSQQLLRTQELLLERLSYLAILQPFCQKKRGNKSTRLTLTAECV